MNQLSFFKKSILTISFALSAMPSVGFSACHEMPSIALPRDGYFKPIFSKDESHFFHGGKIYQSNSGSQAAIDVPFHSLHRYSPDAFYSAGVFSSDGRSYFKAAVNGGLEEVDVRTGTIVRYIKAEETMDSPHHIKISDDGYRIVIEYALHAVLFDLRTNQSLSSEKAFRGVYFDTGFGDDLRTFYHLKKVRPGHGNFTLPGTSAYAQEFGTAIPHHLWVYPSQNEMSSSQFVTSIASAYGIGIVGKQPKAIFVRTTNDRYRNISIADLKTGKIEKAIPIDSFEGIEWLKPVISEDGNTLFFQSSSNAKEKRFIRVDLTRGTIEPFADLDPFNSLYAKTDMTGRMIITLQDDYKNPQKTLVYDTQKRSMMLEKTWKDERVTGYWLSQSGQEVILTTKDSKGDHQLLHWHCDL